MSDVLNYTCPNCSAPLEFSSESQHIHCNSCESNFTIEEIHEYMKKKGLEDSKEDIKWSDKNPEHIDESFKEYNCPSCGAKVICDENTTSTECVYCGNPQIIPKTAQGMFKPDYIIPFKFDKKAAKEALRNFYKGKRLLPNNFKSENRIDSIQGLYVPFWLFNCKGKADINYSCTTVSAWSDGDYNYTRTSFYDVERAGDMEFIRIPADGSTKMPDEYMEAIEPFDYSDFKKFDLGYLAGYLSDKYDVESKECTPRINERIKASMDATFKNTVRGYATVSPRFSDVNIEGQDIEYVLLPVWILTTKYKDKPYTFAMNGQTGELVGNLPIDKGKFLKYFLGISLPLIAIGSAINFFIL